MMVIMFFGMKIKAVVDEGEGSEQPTEPQPTPSPTQPSTGDQTPLSESSTRHDTTQVPSINLEGTGESQWDQAQIPDDSPLSGGHPSNRAEGGLNLEELSVLCTNLSNRVLTLETVKDAQAAKIIALKSRIKKLEKKLGKKESVSKQGRKKAKPGPTLDVFDDLDADGRDYIEIEDVVKEGRQSNETKKLKLTTNTEEIAEDKGSSKKGGSTEELVSTAIPETVSTVRPYVTELGKNLDCYRCRSAILVYERGISRVEEQRTERPRQEPAFMAFHEHNCRYKHAQLNKKTLEEIQKMNKKATSVPEEEVLEEPDSTKVEGHIESTRKKPGRRLKMKATKKSKRQKTNSDLEEENQLRNFLQIVPDKEGTINYEVLEKRFPIVDWESKLYYYDKNGAELDHEELYNLVMQRFETTTPEGVDLVLWGDLKTMFEANADDDLWKNQEEWILKSWNLYDNYGVHILMLEDGTELYMLAERRYPLTKETLERMLALRLIVESESEAAFDLLRFVQKQIDESGSHDGGEKNLHQELASPEQTTLALAIPEQMTTGKETSNPFMVGSLPKNYKANLVGVAVLLSYCDAEMMTRTRS
ncbi:hypothetical protein Tco_0311683 [Tanacetum coccineum]